MQESQYNYLNQDDFIRVIDAIPRLKIRKWYDNDIEMLFKILYHCALRPIEAIKLSKVDFNIIDRVIYLGKTKTSMQDKAVIPKNFEIELTNYLQTKKDGRLFDKLTYPTFYNWLIRLGKILNIEAWIMPQSESGEKTKGHIFRKSIGKDLINQGYSYEIISKHLRHKKPSITIDYYLKASLEAVKEVL